MKRFVILKITLMVLFFLTIFLNEANGGSKRVTLYKQNLNALFSDSISCQSDADCPEGMICIEGECWGDNATNTPFCEQFRFAECVYLSDHYCYFFISSSRGTWRCIFSDMVNKD
ncbi:MAG: hypothetical protein AB9922_10310 [Bacteroidales bacterium]